MLEIGVGTGYWLDFSQEHGWTVDGGDLVPAVVEALQQEHPAGRFWPADVSSPNGVLAQSDGLAEAGYEPSRQRVCYSMSPRTTPSTAHWPTLPALLSPVDTCFWSSQRSPSTRSSHATTLHGVRALGCCGRPKAAAKLGLRLVAVAPTTVLAANPLEASSKEAEPLPRLVAAGSELKKHPLMARVLGPAMFALDAILMHTKEAPTSKILLFRRKRLTAARQHLASS